MASSYSKKISTLLRGIASKRHGYFYCLDCLHSVSTENKLKSHEKVCKNKDFCGIVLSSEKDKILELSNIWILIKCHTLFMLILNH